MMKEITQFLTIIGPFSSAIIAFKLFRMKKLNFINKMFLLYFSLDLIIGALEAYFLLKLHNER